ncbi:MBOAT family protein [Xylophilus rhododendri]|uniref:Probable alginate O-acetylase AlgI n=1 Tax=Xylophilus rhododendri TaxID=2697032 RepID=A0A857J7D7_9BURK|nr:MBOAT family O-acyltransferase [Xylophilus rhododendri]QHI98922.1 MBOAT family protein [Xylophilus rhododendri]
MVFASLEFLLLFFPLFLIAYAVTPRAGRNATLLAGSWIFYGWWSPPFLLMLIGLTALTWAGGLAISATAAPRARKLELTALIVVLAGLLAWFKYANIVVETINQLLGHAGAMPIAWQKIVLPIGLSFIVLQAISYLVDVYRGTVDAQRSFIAFAAYKAMFGQLIAGPIIRYDWVKREIGDRRFGWDGFGAGARRFMVGMSMKVLIADTLAPVADLAFAQARPGFADAWIGCAAYTLQLFFDFAGYSAMAIGIALMLGFRFPENFQHPYLASSIQDFWRRWHLSLSSWIRDYLYIPLGGNRRGSVRTYVNLLLTMAIAGLWHGGDSWNYLLWGIAHGIALCTARAYSASGRSVAPVLARVATLLFVMLAWTLFRAHDFEGAQRMLAGQFGLHGGFALGDALAAGLRNAHLLAFGLGVACVVWPALAPTVTLRAGPRLAAIGALWPVPAFLLSFALIASRGAVPFLYFQF